MNKCYQAYNCRVHFRPIEANWHDAYLVTKWRNQDDARAAFFSTDIVTPDSHMRFVQKRLPHDLVWIVEHDGTIGMTALTVNVEEHTGEYGRTYIDPTRRSKGYAEDTEFTVLCFGFDVLGLDSLWLDALTTNTAILALHNKLGWSAGEVYEHSRGLVQHMVYTKERWNETFAYLAERAKERYLRCLSR